MYTNNQISKLPFKHGSENQSNFLNNMFSGSFLDSTKSPKKRSSAVFDPLNQTHIDNYETNDLVLELKWSERDLINLHLNQLSGSLFTTNTPEYRNSLIQTNNDIIIRLGDLRLSELNLNSNKFDNDKRKRMKVTRSCEPTLELNWNVRLRLMDHLILNKNLTILRSDSINGKTKHQLLNENNGWIQTLQTLPIGITIDDEDDDLAESLQNQSTDCLMDKLINNVNNQIINNIKLENRNVFRSNSTMTSVKDGQITKQDKNLSTNNVSSSMGDKSNNNLVKQINVSNQSPRNSEKSNTSATDVSMNVSKELDTQDKNRTELEFTVKIINFDFFLTTNKRVHSTTFHLKGIPFNLSLRNKELKQTNKVYKYMDFNLHCLQNNVKNWREDIYFELRCLSQDTEVPDIVKKFDYVFTPTSQTYQSLNYFSYNTVLEYLKKNFVKNNQIYFQCYCKCKNSNKI